MNIGVVVSTRFCVCVCVCVTSSISFFIFSGPRKNLSESTRKYSYGSGILSTQRAMALPESPPPQDVFSDDNFDDIDLVRIGAAKANTNHNISLKNTNTFMNKGNSYLRRPHAEFTDLDDEIPFVPHSDLDAETPSKLRQSDR